MYGFLFGGGVAQNSARQTCAPSLIPQPVCKQPTMVASCQLYVNYKFYNIYLLFLPFTYRSYQLPGAVKYTSPLTQTILIQNVLVIRTWLSL